MLKTALSAKSLLNSTSMTRMTRTSLLALAGLVAATAPAFAINDNELPQGGSVASGSASFNYGSDKLGVYQGTDRVVIDWNSFNIGQSATTQFYQPGSSSVAVNRVHDVNPSQILGNLFANGNIVVLNTNGVFFGPNAHVDVSGLLVSTGKVDAEKFMADGSINLSDINANAAAKIVNEGQITVQNAGIAAFVAPSLSNNGIIEANLGKIALASGGSTATVDLYGDGLVEMALDASSSKALIDNTGTLRANGGKIAVTAKAAAGVVNSVINMGGVVEANTVGVHNGKIVLKSSGALNVTGKVSATGGNGFVETSGEKLAVHGDVLVDNGGEWLLDPTDLDIVHGNGDGGNFNPDDSANDSWYWVGDNYINAALNAGANVTLQTSAAGVNQGNIVMHGDAVIDKTTGVDSTLTLNAHNDITINGLIEASGSGKLNVTLNADYDHSGGDSDAFIYNNIVTNGGNLIVNVADDIDVTHNATINTNGGNVTFFSNNTGDGSWVWMPGSNAGVGTGTIETHGGKVDVTTGKLDLTGGSSIDAAGGDITINNSGIATIDADTLTTSGSGKISIWQNVGGKIQSVINAINNLGGGVNVITVGDGTYNENLTLAESRTTLKSANGRDNTTINGISNVGALGTVVIGNNANNVNIGDVGHGFTINGIDNGVPGIENAAVYLQGNHTLTGIYGNKIVAQGDEALVTEYGLTNDGLFVDGNIFTGQTYTGAPGSDTIGNQFTDPNVARELVVFNHGVTNLQFNGNQVTGDSGHAHLVDIGATHAQVSGNTLNGSTSATVLRIREDDVSVTNNTINGNDTAENAIWATGSHVTINGGNNISHADTGIYGTNVNGLVIDGNTIHDAGSFGIYLDGGNVQATRAIINNNTISGIGAHAIHTRDNQYATITNNNISDTNVGITTENFSQAAADGQRTLIDNNTISARSIGIRNNLSYGNQSGFTISNNTITAEDPSNARRWTGIDVISQMDGVATNFTNNNIDGSAVNGSRQTAGFELTNMTNVNRATIDGGTIKNVDVGVWATDGSFYTGAVSDLLIKNVAFSDIGEEAILAEDTTDPNSDPTINVNATSTHITIGAGNTFTNTPYDLAIAGGATVGLDAGFTGVNNTFVKGAGPAHYVGNPYGTTTNLTTDNGSIQVGVDATTAGGNVTVDYGTFTEQVEIAKNLTLKGQGIGNTIIKSPALLSKVYTAFGIDNKPVILVHDADNVTVEDFTVDGDHQGSANYRFSGIAFYNAGGLIFNNEVENIGDTVFDGAQGGNGIYAYNVDGHSRVLNIFNNNVHDFQKNGITVSGAGLYSTISGNVVHGLGAVNFIAQNGIQVSYGANATVEYNNIFDIGYTPSNWSASSILVYQAGDGVNVAGNQIIGTGVDLGVAVVDTNNTSIGANYIDNSGIGVYLYNTNGAQVASNHITDSDYGVYADYVNGTNISYNTITGSSIDGVFSDSGSNLTVYNNTINNSGDDGIDVDNTTGTVSLTYNKIDGTHGGHESNGIEILNTSGAILDHNTIKNTDWNNINVAGATGTQITNNTLSNSVSASGIGIWQGSDNTKIDANTISGSQYGIWNQGGSLEISRNTLDGAAVDGIYLTGTNSANIHNNFIQNNGAAGIVVDGGTNNVTVYDNSFINNVKNLINTTANLVNASFNWWGSNVEATVVAGLSGLVDFSPYQGEGTDTSVEVGYQGNHGNVYVTNAGAQHSGLIQEAVDDASAGGHVNVNAGTYTENVNLNKSGLKLTGMPGATVDYDAANAGINGTTPGAIFTVTASGVNIDPFVFDGLNLANYGVYTLAADNLVVDGNTFLNFLDDAIHVENSSNITLQHNVIHNVGGDAIDVRNDANAHVWDNVIGYTDSSATVSAGAGNIGNGGNGGDGVFVTNSDGTSVLGNKITGTTYNGPARKGSGILVTNTDNFQIGGLGLSDGNTITDAGSDGIVVRADGGSANGGYIDGNTINGTTSRTGIYTEGASNVLIRSNNISGTGRYAAIFANGGSNFTISNNTLNHNAEEGILVWNAGGTNLIDSNTIDNTGENVKASDGTNVGDAIHVQNTSGLTISNNTIGKNGGNIRGDGVYVTASNGASIHNNTINDTQFKTADANGSNGSGVQVINTDGANISDNTITNAQWDGVRLQNDSNVTVNHNNIDNTGRVNIWGGNINTAHITNNTVTHDHLGGYGAIHADGGSNWTVTGNTVGQKFPANGSAGDYGIFLNGTGGTNLIDSNTVDSTTADGIRALNTSNLTISNNDVGDFSFIGGDGIHVENSAGAKIKNNNALNISGQGIYVSGSDNALISGNTIDGAVAYLNGIDIENSDGVQILNNTIGGITLGTVNTLDGVLVENGSDSATVSGNTITLKVGHGNGVEVKGGINQTVSNNTINGAIRGIWLENTGAGANVTGNTVGQTTGSSDNGIELLNTAAANVSGNHVYKAGWDGININANTGLVTVANNDIHNTIGASGIAFVFGTGGGVADSNTIENSARLGIYDGKANNVTIKNNTITNSGTAHITGFPGPFEDGIFIEGANNILIDNNTINTASGDGIRVGGQGNWAPSATTGIVIKNNKIGLTGGANNIKGNGIEVISSNGVNIDTNTVSNVVLNGILVDPTSGEVIDHNTINNTGLAGIEVSGDDNVTVTNNTIHDTGTYGIHGLNLTAATGTLKNTFSGNTIYNTGSNGIDLENAANIIVSGNFIGYTDSTHAGATHNIHGDGIYVSNATGGKSLNKITGNKITQTQFTVPDANGSNGSGIQVVNTNGITIGGASSADKNTISNNDWDGIRLQNDNDVDARNNNIDTVGRVGIYGGNITNSVIRDNTIKNTTRYGSVYTEGGHNLSITGNTITNSAETGIYMDNVGGTNLVDNNTINTTGTALKASDGSNSGDAIRIVNAAGSPDGADADTNPDAFTTVSHNKVGLTGGANNINGNGISIINSNYAVVSANQISNTTGNGTFIDPSAHVFVTGNTYNNIALNGIYSLGNDDITIGGPNNSDGNTINNVGLNGILVDDTGHTGFTSKIQKNKISVAGNDGIQVLSGSSALIDSNSITGSNGSGNTNGKAGAGRDGIHVEGNNNVTISNNTISGGAGGTATSGTPGAGGVGAVNDGIFVKLSNNAKILSNTITGGLTALSGTLFGVHFSGGNGGNGANNNGIEVSGGTDALIDKNTITGGLLGNAKGAANDGIHVDGNQQAVITNNKILANLLLAGAEGAGHDGINVNNSGSKGTNNKNGVVVTGNTVQGGLASKGAVNDGIHVNNSAGKGSGAAALVGTNTITNVGNDGIFVNSTKGVNVLTNTVTLTGDDGIEVDNSDNAQIKTNKVTLAGDTGILVDPSSNTVTDGNTVTLSGTFGIRVIGGTNNTVSNNTVSLSGDDGIRLDNNAFSKVLTNKVSLSGGDGIEINGGGSLFGFPLGSDIVDGNTVTLSSDNGVNFHDSVLGKITNNTITLSGANGILADNAQGIEVGTNKVTLSSADGIHVHNSLLANIHDNTVTLSGDNGIFLDGSALAKINNNLVTLSGLDGIYVNNVAGLTVDSNTVTLSGDDGIDARNIVGGNITNNIVTLSSNDGIALRNSGLVNINTNTVTLSGGNGIYVDPSIGINIIGNIVTLSGLDGIFATDVLGLNIQNNLVTLSALDGIDVSNSAAVDVSNNVVTLSGDNGIEANNTLGLNIANNVVSLSGNDGIKVDGTLGFSVDSNVVTLSGNNGIELSNAALGTVDGNIVTLSANDGIYANGIAGVGIDGNIVTLSGDDGIDVDGAAAVSVDGNIVTLSGDNGIEVSNVALGSINGNVVTLSAEDGIDLNGAALVSVDGNVVTLSGHDGIKAKNIIGGTINGNVVTLSGHNGIDLRNAALVAVNGNVVTLSGNDGIFVDPSFGIDVSGNVVTLSGNDGIHVEDVIGLTVNNNIVTLSGDDGIDVDGAALYTINNNLVTLSGDNGIELSHAALGTVDGNIIALAGNDGIHVNHTIGTLIAGNAIGLVGGDGIDVRNSDLVAIAGNLIGLTGANGININNSDDVAIGLNFITLTGGDGIHIRNSDHLLVGLNLITLTGGDGIDANNVSDAFIGDNAIALTLGDGIRLTNSDDTTIRDNVIAGTGKDGIHLRGDDNTLVDNNYVLFTAGDGVDAANSTNTTISDNVIAFNGGDGIKGRHLNGFDIHGNEIAFAAGDGIDLNHVRHGSVVNNDVDFVLGDGIKLNHSHDVDITDNTIGFNGFVGGNGIDIRNSHDINVTSNVIGTNVQGDGIFIDPSFNISLIDNLIDQVGGIGINVSGQGNGLIVLSGNTVNSRPGGIGARFESGQIDLTGASNTFNGGATGLLFDPGVGGDPLGLTLVGDTFGTTVFNGQSGYYIDLENGAFFDPGNPTILDASQVSFDGLVTGTNDLTGKAYAAALEAKLHDFDDDNTLGQIFFESVSGIDANLINPQEFLAFIQGGNGGSVTILGLPFAKLGKQVQGGNLANLLASLNPAAGGNEKGNGEGSQFISLADRLNNIDTAAGAENASCWGQVYSHLTAASAPVTYNMDSTPGALLSAQSHCTTGL